ncbi:MAG: hypothetical protein NW224_18350 [Leptolyngbyaceae cyanobacterium bins.302]|nr:hypothetical protein [Leptolyngbyaceae cyanobacterium bins.302]
MPSTLQSNEITDTTTSTLLNPLDIIDRMIELRIQLQELQNEIASLQPAFFAACLTLNTEKIERTRAVITRRLTPGQWTYSIDILEQDSFLKQLKKQFHQNHEPTSGRELTWAMKLLLNLA